MKVHNNMQSTGSTVLTFLQAEAKFKIGRKKSNLRSENCNTPPSVALADGYVRLPYIRGKGAMYGTGLGILARLM